MLKIQIYRKTEPAVKVTVAVSSFAVPGFAVTNFTKPKEYCVS